MSGVLLTWAHNFIGNEVHTQLAAQQILILGGLGLVHARRTSPATDILAGHPAHAPDPGTPPRQDTHSGDQQPSNDGLAGTAPGRSAGPSA